MIRRRRSVRRKMIKKKKIKIPPPPDNHKPNISWYSPKNYNQNTYIEFTEKGWEKKDISDANSLSVNFCYMPKRKIPPRHEHWKRRRDSAGIIRDDSGSVDSEPSEPGVGVVQSVIDIPYANFITEDHGSFLNYLVSETPYNLCFHPGLGYNYDFKGCEPLLENRFSLAKEIVKKSTKNFLNKEYKLKRWDNTDSKFSLLHIVCGLTIGLYKNKLSQWAELMRTPLQANPNTVQWYMDKYEEIKLIYHEDFKTYKKGKKVEIGYGLHMKQYDIFHKNHLDLINEIIKKGGDMHKKDFKGVTPIDILYGWLSFLINGDEDAERGGDFQFMNLDMSPDERVDLFSRCDEIDFGSNDFYNQGGHTKHASIREIQKLLTRCDPVVAIQKLFRGNKIRLGLNEIGKMTKKTKQKHWGEIEKILKQDGIDKKSIKEFHDNHYMKSSSSSTKRKYKKYDKMLKDKKSSKMKKQSSKTKKKKKTFKPRYGPEGFKPEDNIDGDAKRIMMEKFESSNSKDKKKSKSQKGSGRSKQNWEKNEGYFGPIMGRNGKLNREEICHYCYPSDYAKGARKFCKLHHKVWNSKTNSCKSKKSKSKSKR